MYRYIYICSQQRRTTSVGARSTVQRISGGSTCTLTHCCSPNHLASLKDIRNPSRKRPHTNTPREIGGQMSRFRPARRRNRCGGPFPHARRRAILGNHTHFECLPPLRLLWLPAEHELSLATPRRHQAQGRLRAARHAARVGGLYIYICIYILVRIT